VLIVFSVVALTIALERMTKLTQAKMIPPRFVGGLGELVRRGDASADDFTKLCGQAPSPAASILHAGVIRAGRSLPEVEKSMEDALAREMATLRGRNRPLSVIGSVAPLVGLLGTVVGMIFAFHTASEGGPDAEQLAGGIYLALITTAAGLTIAIPCLLLYAWFNARVERYMREIDEQLLETMPSFARLERNDTKPTPSPRRDPVPIAAGASS